MTEVLLEIAEGEFLCILRPSGCGKITTMYAVARLNPIINGIITLDRIALKGPGADRGIVIQKDSTFLWLAFARNVTYVLKLKGMNYYE